MPMYDFKCKKKGCEKVFEEIAPYDESGKYPGVVCPHCGSKKKTKLVTCPAFNFANPVGTDRWMSEDKGHDYRFKYNIPNVVKEREMAQKMSHMGSDPYGSTNDLDLGEGIHDPETRKGLM